MNHLRMSHTVNSLRRLLSALQPVRHEPDEVEVAVAEALTLVRSESRADVEKAYETLADLDYQDVTAELFLVIEDATSGVNLDALIAHATTPMPPNAHDLVAAIRSKDMDALAAALSEQTQTMLLASLVLLAASLTEARERM